jgi:hypothetical protein
MTDTHVKLYHFTSVEAWPAIRAAHAINPSLPYDRNGNRKDIVWPAVVWLTSDPSFVHARPPTAEMPDKAAVRITVRVPRYLVMRFVDLARQTHCPKGLSDHFKAHGPRSWPAWHLCRSAIPMSMWHIVEYDGYTLYRPEPPARRLSPEQFAREYEGRP